MCIRDRGRPALRPVLQLVRDLDSSHNALAGEEGDAQGGAVLPGGCGPGLRTGNGIEAHGLPPLNDLPDSALQYRALFGSAGHELFSVPSVVGELPGDGVQQDHANAGHPQTCLLYTSDAADDLLCVDLGGSRIIKKKKHSYSDAMTNTQVK